MILRTIIYSAMITYVPTDNYFRLKIALFHCLSAALCIGCCHKPKTKCDLTANFSNSMKPVMSAGKAGMAWMLLPAARPGADCTLEALLALTPPPWAKSLTLHMTFKDWPNRLVDIREDLTLKDSSSESFPTQMLRSIRRIKKSK